MKILYYKSNICSIPDFQLTENLTKAAKTHTIYLHDIWNTVSFNVNQNILIVGHSAESGNVAGHFCYLACAAQSKDATPKIYKISGEVEPLLSWNNGISLGVGATAEQWLHVNLIVL